MQSDEAGRQAISEITYDKLCPKEWFCPRLRVVRVLGALSAFCVIVLYLSLRSLP